MIIERINQNGSGPTRVTPIEKTNPTQPNEDKNQEQNFLQKKSFESEIKKIEEVVKGINDFLQPTHTSIKFVLHDKLKDYYVAVVDDNSKEVIKEIPSKKLLDTYASMMEFVGILVDKKI